MRAALWSAMTTGFVMAAVFAAPVFFLMTLDTLQMIVLLCNIVLGLAAMLLARWLMARHLRKAADSAC